MCLYMVIMRERTDDWDVEETSRRDISLVKDCIITKGRNNPKALHRKPAGTIRPSLNDFIYLLKAYSPVNRTGSPQGFSLRSSNLTQVIYNKHLNYLEYNTKHARYTNITHINIIRKLVPSVLLA